ncbi:MAG: tetratricopeptide repeat protein [Bryobacteraceae bacterium]
MTRTIWLALLISFCLSGLSGAPQQAQGGAQTGNDAVDILMGRAAATAKQGKLADAVRLYLNAEAMAATNRDSFRSARIANNLGALYYKLSRYGDAELSYKRAVEGFSVSDGPQSNNVAISLSNLGELYRRQARYADAEDVLRRSLAIREKVFGPEHRNVALGLNTLLCLYNDLGRYHEAVALGERAFEIWEKYPPEDPHRATLIHNQAENLRLLKRWDQSEVLQKRALDLRERLLGPTSPEVASSLNSLGSLYQDQNRVEEAEPLYRRALEIRMRHLGPRHPDVALTLTNLAVVARQQRRFETAIAIQKEALSILRETLGSGHPASATSQSNLGAFYFATGDLAAAEPLLRDAIRIFESSAPKHVNLFLSLSVLGELFVQQEKYPGAEKLFRRALSVRPEALTDHDPLILRLRQRLGEIAVWQARLKKAVTLDVNKVDVNSFW